VFFRLFVRHNGVAVYFFNAGVPAASFLYYVFPAAQTGFFVKPKAVFLPVTERRANDFSARFVYGKLRLLRAPFFLSGIEFPLFFLGRSTGVSVASIKMTS
jgi:hypothetical protein